MAAAAGGGGGGRSSTLKAPNLTTLETSRSIRRSLISNSSTTTGSEDSPSSYPSSPSPCGLSSSGRKLAIPLDLSRSSSKTTTSTGGGERHLLPHHVCASTTSRIVRFACFAFVTLTAILIFGSSTPVYTDLRARSCGCSCSSSTSDSPSSSSSSPSIDNHNGELESSNSLFAAPSGPQQQQQQRRRWHQQSHRADLPGLKRKQKQKPKPKSKTGPVAAALRQQQLDHHHELDDSSCWSRSRHLRYRRGDQLAPPSPLLEKALERYAALHARCTAGIEKKWEDSIENFPSSSSTSEDADDDRSSSCKYLVYIEGWEGLGNRLLSLVTAFTYALATNRVLLVDTRRKITDLLCEPFRGSSWSLPPSFPYEKVESLPALDEPNNGDDDEELGKMRGLHLKLRHEQSPREQRFFCIDVQRRLQAVPWIAWSSNQYYVPRLFMMPFVWKRLSPLFEDYPSRVFTQLSRYLLLPQNAVWLRTERIYRAYLAGPPRSGERARERERRRRLKVVGIQLRTPKSRVFEQTILDRVVHCLVDDRILPNVSGSSSIERQEEDPSGGGGGGTSITKPFHENARQEVEGEGEGEEEDQEEKGSFRTTSIFVASLQREYYQRLKDVYLERGTADNSLVTVHTMAADHVDVENDSYNQSIKAFVDMWLLSFSDSLVTTSWSTFGYIAQGLGGVRPYIVNTDPQQTASCFPGQSAEPCNHFPFLSTCPQQSYNMSPEHSHWVQKHIRPCQDEPKGLQLVDSSSKL